MSTFVFFRSYKLNGWTFVCVLFDIIRTTEDTGKCTCPHEEKRGRKDGRNQSWISKY